MNYIRSIISHLDILKIIIINELYQKYYQSFGRFKNWTEWKELFIQNVIYLVQTLYLSHGKMLT